MLSMIQRNSGKNPEGINKVETQYKQTWHGTADWLRKSQVETRHQILTQTKKSADVILSVCSVHF
jgi:phage-related minor tail protein